MKSATIALIASLAAISVPATQARSAAPRATANATAGTAATVGGGNVQAGRALALQACTGCHVVAPDQPFAPVFTGPPPPPDFRAIANRPDVTAKSLHRTLAGLPAVPPPGTMANPDLSDAELANVVAYIMSLREDH